MSAAQQSLARRVLVADDNESHRAFLGQFLYAEGYVVAEACDGQELLDLLFSVRPGYFDAVICDQLMPKLRGTECLARASTRSRWLIVTSSSDPHVAELAHRYGAAAFLRKPFDIVTLSELVDELTRDGPPTGVRATRRSEPPREG
jgi:CheY-like chemotaxis protein